MRRDGQTETEQEEMNRSQIQVPTPQFASYFSFNFRQLYLVNILYEIEVSRRNYYYFFIIVLNEL